MRTKTIKTLSDAEMPLFAGLCPTSIIHTPVKTENGRGNGSTRNAYNAQTRKCRYSVHTRVVGQYAHREIRVVQETGVVKSDFAGTVIQIQADAANMRGYGMMRINMVFKDGSKKSIYVNQAEARHLAQALNAAANSCSATWRKSSLDI